MKRVGIVYLITESPEAAGVLDERTEKRRKTYCEEKPLRGEEIALLEEIAEELMDAIPCTAEITLIAKLSKYTDAMFKTADELEAADKAAAKLSGLDQAKAFRETVLPLMEELRTYVDSAEVLTADEYWPVSTYGELLFKV